MVNKYNNFLLQLAYLNSMWYDFFFKSTVIQNCLCSVAPVCRQGQQKVVGAAKQEAARISCEVDANPNDVHFTWKFNNSGESMEIPPSHFTIDRSRSLASYTPLTDQDYGTLLCWARNEFGEQKLPCVFHVVPAGMYDVKY